MESEGSDYESPTNLHWKDFFGSSLDLSPALMSIYDQYALKNQDVTPPKQDVNDNKVPQGETFSSKIILNQNREKSLNQCDSTRDCDVIMTQDQSGCDISYVDSATKQTRPLSMSSLSSTSTCSLPNNYQSQQQTVGDYEVSSSGVETGSRSSYGHTTDISSSNVSMDATSIEESESVETAGEDGIIYDKVYDEENSDSNIYENITEEEHEEYTDTNEEEIYSNFKEFCENNKNTRKFKTNSALCNNKQQKPMLSEQRSTRSRKCKSSVESSAGQLSEDPSMTYAERVTAELIETEQTYMKSLQEIILGYMHDLNHSPVNESVSEEDKEHLFGNLVDIYQFSRELLRDLIECGNSPVRVASCFVKKSKGFSIYASYCTNYPKSMEVLTKFMSDHKIAEVFRLTQACLGHGLALGAYLLKPVQRILKYHLLFQNIVKNYNSESEGYEIISQALDTMTTLAKDINEMKRKHEHAVRIQEVGSLLEDYMGPDLTTLGDLVLEGSFRTYGAKASRQTFLFERAILVTKKKATNMMSCKTFIMCNNLMLVESVPKEPQSFHVIPFDSPKQQCTLVARNIDMKRRWCQEIKKLILASYSDRIPEKAKSLVMELGRLSSGTVGLSDFVDNSSGYKQHTAPGYLEKRVKGRRKSGTIIDFPLLKNRRGAHKKIEDTTEKGEVKPQKREDYVTEECEDFVNMMGSKSMTDISRRNRNQSELPDNVDGHRNLNHSSVISKKSCTLPSRITSTSQTSEDDVNRMSSADFGKASSDMDLYESSGSDSSETDSETDDKYMNVMYTRKKSSNDGTSTKKIDGDNYVTLIANSEDQIFNNHKPLHRMRYVEHSTPLSDNPIGSSTIPRSSFTKNTSPSPIRSTGSSYENLSSKTEHSSKPSLLPKPTGIPTSGLRQYVSQPCLVSQRPVSWSNSEVTIYEDDPWIKNIGSNEEPMHPVLKNISQCHAYKTCLPPGIKAASQSKSNFDWFVYKSKLRGSPINGFGKDAKHKNNIVQPQLINTVKPNSATGGKFPEDTIKPSMDRVNGIVKLQHGTNPTLYSNGNKNKSSQNLSIILKSQNKTNNDLASNLNSDQIVNQLEQFVREQEPKNELNLPKFPTSAYVSYQKSKKSNSICSSKESVKSVDSIRSMCSRISSPSPASNQVINNQQKDDERLDSSFDDVYKFCSNVLTNSSKWTQRKSADSRRGKVNQLARKYSSQGKLSQAHSRQPLEMYPSDSARNCDGSRPSKTRSMSYPGSLPVFSRQSDSESETMSKRLSRTLEIYSENSLDSGTFYDEADYLSESMLDNLEQEQFIRDADDSSFLELSGTDYSCDEINYLQQQYTSLYPEIIDFRKPTKKPDKPGANKGFTFPKGGVFTPPITQPKPKVSIKKHVQILEANNQPRPNYIVDAKKRTPCNNIQERLRHLRQCQNQQAQRMVDLSSEGDLATKSLRSRKVELFMNSKTLPNRMVNIQTPNRKLSVLKTAHSTGAINNIENESSLSSMKGWVQRLILKFQSET